MFKPSVGLAPTRLAAVGFQTVAAGIAAESVLAAAKIVGAGDGGHHTVRILGGPTAGSQGGGETGQEQGGSKGCKALVAHQQTCQCLTLEKHSPSPDCGVKRGVSRVNTSAPSSPAAPWGVVSPSPPLSLSLSPIAALFAGVTGY